MSSLLASSEEGTPDILADLIYAPNVAGKVYKISVSTAENAKDLFTFCLHMLMLGLVRRQGGDRLNLLEVSASDLEFVEQRLRLIGIVMHHAAVPQPQDWVAMGTNLDVIALMPDSLRLPEYVFKFYDGLSAVRHDIHFDFDTLAELSQIRQPVAP